MKKLIKYIKWIFLVITLPVLYNQMVGVNPRVVSHEESEIQSRIENEEPFKCILSSSRRDYKIGEALELDVRIINNTDSSVYFA